MTTLTDITVQLAEPFAVEDIDFLPKSKVERDGKTLCMALPYADPRVYQDRLNKLAPGEWETPPPIALTVGDKLVTYVTVIICGVQHTDVGEAGPGENQGTEAFSQALKRACSQFGLGRYLYDLDKEWVPFNPQKKLIDLDAAGKRAIVRKMYQKAGIIEKASEKPATVSTSSTSTQNGKETPAPSGDVVEASPEEIAKTIRTVKSLLNAHYQIPQVDQSAKWRSFKELVLGLPVEDEGLSLPELKRLRDAVKMKIANAKGAA